MGMFYVEGNSLAMELLIAGIARIADEHELANLFVNIDAYI